MGCERRIGIKNSSKGFDLSNLKNGVDVSLNGEDWVALVGGVAVQIRNLFLDMLSLKCLLDILVKYVVKCMSFKLEKTELEL